MIHGKKFTEILAFDAQRSPNLSLDKLSRGDSLIKINSFVSNEPKRKNCTPFRATAAPRENPVGTVLTDCQYVLSNSASAAPVCR